MKTPTKISIVLLSSICVLFVCCPLIGQNLLNNPESVVFDKLNNRYLVSNWADGNIIQIDSLGIVSYFNTDLEQAAGLHILGNTLYVAPNYGDISGIVGIDLTTADTVFHLDIPDKQLLNDIASDTSGNLYITDCEANKIFRVNIEDSSYITFVDSGLGYPNGICFDTINNRLLVLNGQLPYQPLLGISLPDASIETIVQTSITALDGLAIDRYGHYYFSSWTTDCVYRYDLNFTNPPQKISCSHYNPADIFINLDENILAVPNFNGNEINFIPLGETVIHVPSDQPTIQAGINKAIDGDTVIVAPGIYFENINFAGKNIVLASNYLYSVDFVDIENTIIDGGNPLTIDTASCVMFSSGEDSSAVLLGFTIRNGSGTHWVDPQYPAYTWHSGGGIFIFQSSPTIKNNYIINNHCDDNIGASGASGGGICSYGGNPYIINNLLKNNTALYGAGVVIDYSGCVFKNNIVANNSCGQNYGGGGFWMIGNGNDPVIIENNTIVNNVSENSGGAFYLWSTQLIARNNIIWGNSQTSGDPLYLRDGATADITFTDIEGGFSGEGNIELQPLFADTNFILQPSSPCIDTGNPDAIFNDCEDPLNPGNALWPSMGNTINDMGAYGGPRCRILAGLTVGLNKRDFDAYENFELIISPNPFTHFTTITFPGLMDQTSGCRAEIYNFNGQLVMDFGEIGECNYFVWDGLDNNQNQLTSGIYFIRISTGKTCNTKAIILKR